MAEKNFKTIESNFKRGMKTAPTLAEDQGVNPTYREALKKGILKISDNTAMLSDWNISGVNGIHVKTDGMYRVFHDLPEGKIDKNGLIDGASTNEAEEQLPYHRFILHLECKKELDVRDKDIRTQCIMQVCSYIYQLADKLGLKGDRTSNDFWKSNSHNLPSVVLIGSNISCYMVHIEVLYEHLVTVKFWDGIKSASTIHEASDKNKMYFNMIKANPVLDRGLSFECKSEHFVEDLCDYVLKLGKNVDLSSDLNINNLSRAFDYFDMYVLDIKEKAKMTSRKEVELFLQMFFSEDDAMTGKIKKHDLYDNKLTYKGEVYKINPEAYNVFAGLYAQREYSKAEIKELTAIQDRLLQDADRRRKGDFYTPTIWVDEAHKLMDRNLKDWRQRCIVWDCAWGTGNLTRDYKFNELYASTLQSEDIAVASLYNQEGSSYNKLGKKFQYDFLNDDVYEFEAAKAELEKPFKKLGAQNYKIVEPFLNLSQYKTMLEQLGDKLSTEIRTEAEEAYNKAVAILMNTKLAREGGNLMGGLIEGREIVFLINPPYAAANNMKKQANTSGLSKGTSDTKIKEQMKETEAGKSGQNLYNQFIYRIYKLGCLVSIDKVHIGIFCPTQLHTGRANEGLRKLLKNFWIKEMFMLQASQFADVKGNWSISFSIIQELNERSNNIKCIAYDCANGALEDGIEKSVYNLDGGNDSAAWVREPDKKKKTELGLQLSSALNIGKGNAPLGRVTNDHIGYCVMDGNNIDANASQVYLLSTSAYHGHGVSVTKDSFDRVVSLFAARKLISGEYANWVNCKDEYMIPNVNHPKYQEWQNDSIVYSLFNTASNQSSLRNIEYNGRTWNIFNEFFWMSSKTMEELADGTVGLKIGDPTLNNKAVLNDVEQYADKERYVYLRLKELKDSNSLSPEALAVLTEAENLVLNSFKYRKEFDIAHPEYHINTWDAGWYQIKGLLKEYDKEGLKAFNKLYEQLSNKMRPLVYELGFLYK